MVLLVVNNVKKNKYFFFEKCVALVPCTWWILGSAPVHHAQTALGFLREQGVEFWSPQNVPPNSQDFSLCDYDIWSYIEGKVCKTSSSSLALLRCHIRAVRSTTPADKILQLFSPFKSYFQKPFEAKGP